MSTHGLLTLASLVVYLCTCAVAAADQEMVWPGATWETTSPESVRMDANLLEALAKHVGGRGCVIRHGRIVYSWGDIRRRGDVASAAKPWYSHFILKAIEDGKIPGLDTPVADFEPRLRAINANLGHKDSRITWRHMANQTSCYGVADEPGSAYDYNDWHMALLWDTLFLKVYGTTWERVDAEVVRPLLADILQCEDQPTFMAFGLKDRAGRLGVSPRDFARFGLLYLRGGQWNGRQVLSPEHVRLATRSGLSNAIPRTAGEKAEMVEGQRSIGSRNIPDNQCDHMGSYSFLWWTNGVDRDGRRHWPNAPHDAYGAFGHGGPRAMVVIPSLDVIVSWNDANIKSREAENEALRLLTEACVDRDPMWDRIVVDPDRPARLMRKGGSSVFIAGPGDPEDFLYRGTLREDGTRDGDQMALIRKVAATGANCIYMQVIRSHGGDGDETHNPFIGHDPAKGLNEAVLDQWETWFTTMDEADVCIYLFIYDDSARIWDTDDDVGREERAFLEGIVNRFEHHRNLIWCVAEEYQERFSPARVRAIAKVIREADANVHPIAVHKLHGLDFAEFADDPIIDQFAVQYNVKTATELHEGLVRAHREARGRYSINMSECADMGTGAELRRKLWAAAMAGAHAMVLRMDIASTPEEDLYACGRLARFMGEADLRAPKPQDELAARATQYVLVDPDRAYVLYTSKSGKLGLRDLPAGPYAMTWLDCETGAQVRRHNVRIESGTQMWPRPEGFGDEVAVRVDALQ